MLLGATNGKGATNSIRSSQLITSQMARIIYKTCQTYITKISIHNFIIVFIPKLHNHVAIIYACAMSAI